MGEAVWGIIKEVVPFVSMAIVVILIAFGRIESLSFGKLNVHGKKKVLKLSNLNNILDREIVKLDGEMIDFATHQADLLRRKLLHFLEDYHKSPFGRRVISSAIRFPLYHAARRNKFCVVLRPSNIGSYVDGLVKEIKMEYADVNAEQSNFECPVNKGSSCMEYPEWAKLEKPLRDLLLREWAYPIKDHRIKISEQKNEQYKLYLPMFDELGDSTRTQITKQCIEKNAEYINQLKNRGDIL